MRGDAPTKTNLIRIRNELKFARLGHELLDQKRNILVVELLSLVDQATDYQERVEQALSRAYRSLEEAVLRMGKLRVLSLASATHMQAEITLKQRRVMGVMLPVVETGFSEHPPYYSFQGTSSVVDTAVEKFKEALSLLGRMAELKISISRLASEVQKTIRKVNALEKIAIPELDETLRHIQDRLEESERDMFVLMKMVKARLEKKRGQDNGRSH